MRYILRVLSLILLAATPVGATNPPPEFVFVSAGSHYEARSSMSGAVLPDGRALFAGFQYAQIYSPQSHSWEAPVHFIGSHFLGSTILLADGRVLVLGTTSSSTGPAAEIIDPTTSQVINAGTGAARRYSAHLMMRADGRVVVWSGLSTATGWPPVATSELFDPDANIFSPLTVPFPSRWNASVVSLSDGRYLIAGGSIESGVVQKQAMLYNPNTNTATIAGNQTNNASVQSVIRLQDGRILLCGGYMYTASNSIVATNRAEIYNPQNSTFTSIAPMNVERVFASIALLTDGRVLLAGGLNLYNQYLGTAEVFDPVTERFTRIDATLIRPRAESLALSIGGNRLILAGGKDSVGDIRESEAFIPDAIMAASFD